MSLAWAERRTSLRKRRTSAAVASPTTFCARTTRPRPYPPSSRTLATTMPASTSELAAAAQTEFLLLCDLCSVTGRGIPDIAGQSLDIPVVLGGKFIYAEGTSYSTPVRLPSLPPC